MVLGYGDARNPLQELRSHVVGVFEFLVLLQVGVSENGNGVVPDLTLLALELVVEEEGAELAGAQVLGQVEDIVIVEFKLT